MRASSSSIQTIFFNRTGIWEDVFNSIHQELEKLLQQQHFVIDGIPHSIPRKRKTRVVSLSSYYRLLLLLHWLRHYPSFQDLARIYNVSTSFVQRDITILLPLVYHILSKPEFNKIGAAWKNLPLSSIAGFERIAGVIDCTSHFRNRVHPGQRLYYRGDKHAHFLTDQVVCTLDGQSQS